MTNRGSLNLPPDEHTLVSDWHETKKALRTGPDTATENIRTLRRGNGLPATGRIHARWTDAAYSMGTVPTTFRHQRREPDESMGLVVVLGILIMGFVLGLCVAFLTGWRPL